MLLPAWLKPNGGHDRENKHDSNHPNHEAQQHRLQEDRIGDAIKTAKAQADGDRPDHDANGKQTPNQPHCPGPFSLAGAINDQSEIGRGGQGNRQPIKGKQPAKSSDP